MGLYVTEFTTIRNLLDALINPCAAYWTFTREGLLSAGFIDTAGTPNLSIDAKAIDAKGVSSPEPMTPAWRISVGYAPVWSVQAENELVAGTSDERRSFVGQSYRTVVSESRAVRTKNAHALELTFNTMLADKEDAENLLDRLVRVYGDIRKIYSVPTYGVLFRAYIGDTVHLQYPRYGIDGSMIVVGISEDAQTNQTTMELWG
jgi:hypothetical protein